MLEKIFLGMFSIITFITVFIKLERKSINRHQKFQHSNDYINEINRAKN